jgi:NADH-quinone oxidoreductase subunit J
MLTRAPIGRDLLDNHQRPVAAVLGFGIFVGLVYLIQNAYPLGQAGHPRSYQATTGIIGDAIFRGYILPFEAISFLLLAALIGAIVLARRDEAP